VSCGKFHFSLLVSSDSAGQVVKDTNALAQPFADLGIMTTLSTAVTARRISGTTAGRLYAAPPTGGRQQPEFCRYGLPA
jgi:hypothetical protein